MAKSKITHTDQPDDNGAPQPVRIAPPGAEPVGEATPKGENGRKRTGAPKGNTNAIRHGMRGSKLPAGCKYIENRVNALRRQVEEVLLEVKGEIGIIDAAAVNSILKWERHGLLAAHWLRTQIDVLSASDRLRFSEAIAKASDNRDKAIRSLGLDRDRTEDELDALYRLPAPEPEQPQDTEEETTDGQT